MKEYEIISEFTSKSGNRITKVLTKEGPKLFKGTPEEMQGKVLISDGDFLTITSGKTVKCEILTFADLE